MKPLKPITIIAWCVVFLGCLSLALGIVFTAEAYHKGFNINQHLLADALIAVSTYLAAVIADKSEK